MVARGLHKFQGIGPKTLERLSKLDIVDLPSLLFHLPLRYEDRTKIYPLEDLFIGCHAAVLGTIVESRIIKRGRSILHCTLHDGHGFLRISFFNFAKFRLQFKLRIGVRLQCYGEVRSLGNTLGMVHPEYRILGADEIPSMADTLTAVYPTTAGLSQSTLRKLVAQALVQISTSGDMLEVLPEALLTKLNFSNIVDALIFIHQPPSGLSMAAVLDRCHPMRQRLIFEELLAVQMSILKLRLVAKNHEAHSIHWSDEFCAQLFSSLPFALTMAQCRVVQEIAVDLRKNQPMLRLVQGDVGCGKTIIAAVAIGQVVLNGYQAAIMVPTELLARQHFKNLSHWLAPFGIRTALLVGNTLGTQRASILSDVEDGSTQVIVGTHALFQSQLQFKNLTLVVIDEQQRFGVHQRLQFRAKGVKNGYLPHQLIMTATPIPRTMAMAIYADLDYSIVDEMPPGREEVKTLVIENTRRSEVIERVRSNCRLGKQVYWVCPLIMESESLQCQAAETLARELRLLLPELNLALIHGRLVAEQRELIMAKFLQGEVDLLVATTVIEVGVDVANANLMIIENAERLGLVQLHQLRGRVGRGNDRSYCILMYQSPLSSLAKQRLLLMREQSNGFILAQKDLEMRGAGEILGTKQSGAWELKIANLFLDQGLISMVQEIALELLRHYSTSATTIMNRWLGSRGDYGDVS